MRIVNYILAAAAIATVAIACSKDGNVKMKTVSVELGCPQISTSTKTYLSGTKVMWKSDDKYIACITDGVKGSNWYLLTSTESYASETKTFKGDIPDNEHVVLFAYLCNRNAVSKFNLSKVTGYTTIRNILGNDQTLGQDNTFNTLYNFAIAKPGENHFRNCCGYFKWTNTSEGDIKAVKVETLSLEGTKEYFGGYFDCTYEDADPVTVKSLLNMTSVNACSPYVNSRVTTSSITPDACHYIIVLPGTYHGMKVTITLSDDTSFAIKTSKTFTVTRGAVLDLGVLPTTPISLPVGGEIDFDTVSGEDVGDSGSTITW